MRKKILGAVVFMLTVLLSGSAVALTAGDVIEKANQANYYQADDGRAKVDMTITDSLGRERKRKMTILRLDAPDGEKQKYFIYFDKPDDVKGMTYLVWKKPGEDDDRWLYLPALDLVRRVASSDKRSSFVGSHFAYEEISGRGIGEDLHTIESEDDSFYRIKSVPKDPNSVEFSYFITLIDKETFIPQKEEMYDKNGKLYKILESLEVKDIGGYLTITKMKATDLNAKGFTVCEFSDIGYNVDLKDDIFTERYLRRPPRKYIK